MADKFPPNLVEKYGRDHAATNMTPAQLLAAHDRYWNCEDSTDQDMDVFVRISTAAVFSALAFKRQEASDITHEGAVMALARVFLQAISDPSHADLDYLRADPSSGDLMRAQLKAGEASE